MHGNNDRNITRAAAYFTLGGSLCMLIGAGVMLSTGVDLDQALDAGDLPNYLRGAGGARTALILNLTLWILGVFLLGAAARLMALLGRTAVVPALLVRYTYGVAIPVVVVAYTAWLALVVRTSAQDVVVNAPLADTVGWFASRADWLATVLVLGLGPFLIVRSGQGGWVPRWLFIWGHLCLLPGVLNLVGLYAGGTTTYGFLIIPVGMAWMVAASVVLFKRAGSGAH
ncbi:MAG: hypothetical protein H6597_04560 [Flavobacteriales bacterium]|nr:hypothetical protein [Flavobacteriales bacterium]MCB9193785.1 hypothetical protein [Flavobacteriales bacterium]